MYVIEAYLFPPMKNLLPPSSYCTFFHSFNITNFPFCSNSHHLLQSMANLRSKTIQDLLPKSKKDEKNNGKKKKNSSEASKMKIKIEEPVLSSPSGRPMRAKAGKNKLFE